MLLYPKRMDRWFCDTHEWGGVIIRKDSASIRDKSHARVLPCAQVYSLTQA